MPFHAHMRWIPKECCVQVIKVDSYGVCEQNMQQPDASKDDVLPLAHFTLAFEKLTGTHPYKHCRCAPCLQSNKACQDCMPSHLQSLLFCNSAFLEEVGR